MSIENRVPVRLVGDEPMDPRMLSTLNRFHFKTIHLATDASTHLTLSHAALPPAASGAFMKRAGSRNKPLPPSMMTGLVEISEDYIARIIELYKRYPTANGNIENTENPNSEIGEPMTDVLADKFENEIINALGITPAPKSSRFSVMLTHDVDYADRCRRVDIGYGLRFLANAAKTALSGKAAPFFLAAAAKFLSGRADYYGFDRIAVTAKNLNFKPVFLLYAKLPDGNGLDMFGEFAHLNPIYDIAEGDAARGIASILAFGAEIGIYGSVKSTEDPKLFAEEKKRIESVTGVPVKVVRQRFMEFLGRISAKQYLDNWIYTDLNCGFARDNGYLCGTTRPFYLTDPSDKKRHIITVPTVFVDHAPLLYKPKSIGAVYDDVTLLLDNLKRHNGCAAFNFHQRMLASFPEYMKLYEFVAEKTREMGGDIITPSAIEAAFPTPKPVPNNFNGRHAFSS